LTGNPPFYLVDLHVTSQNIVNWKITWPPYVRKDTKDLISKLLQVDPTQRLPLEDILNHELCGEFWVTEGLVRNSMLVFLDMCHVKSSLFVHV
jgi:serine/threonine protein kinase